MRFRRIIYTVWRTGLSATRSLASLSAFLFLAAWLSGCGGPQVRLSFPLDDGAAWVYQGITTYSYAGQEQTVPPVTFLLKARRLTRKGPAPYDLILTESEEPLFNLQLVSAPRGLVNPLTAEIWLPQNISVGKKWSVTVQGNKVKMTLHSLSQMTVPAGTFSAYQVHFSGPKQDYGSFFLDPQVGVISLDWVSRSSGAKSTTHLELTAYNLP